MVPEMQSCEAPKGASLQAVRQVYPSFQLAQRGGVLILVDVFQKWTITARGPQTVSPSQHFPISCVSFSTQ